MKNKLLLVTFPVDFGSQTWERVLIDTFENEVDLKIHTFSPAKRQESQSKYLNLRSKLVEAYRLCKVVVKARLEGRKILFQGISPALFAFPVIWGSRSYIITDWTRKLYEPIFDTLPKAYFLASPSWLTFIHKLILNSQTSVIGVTDAVIEEIKKDYGVPSHKLKKARFPFGCNLKIFDASPDRKDSEVRLLFVGGDFKRKGGDILLEWFLNQNNENLKLTIVTKSSLELHPNVVIKTDIEFGQEEHIELFKEHDIFVLPTKCDAYPTVLGEATCAGLAMLTTKQALGAPEVIQQGVNGYICSSQEALLEQLDLLVQNKSLIEKMKHNSREFMEKEFASELVLHEFIDYIFG